MSRDSQGVYTLSAGNPVTPGTVIEADWANTTMDDVAVALTDSLPRNGSAPMTGPLTLPATDPTNLNQAVRKGYVDKFLSLSVGLPIGGVLAFASNETPGGFLLCNGQGVSRSTYSELFAIIGTIYGAGDGVNTFNVPDLRGEFIRGRDSSRALGSKQAGSVVSHNHPITDPGHNHVGTDPGHTHVSPEHTHVLTDPGHKHDVDTQGFETGNQDLTYGGGGLPITFDTRTATTGITIAAAAAAVNSATTGVTLAAATTGITTAPFGGTETVPQNVAMDYYIKAINNNAASTPMTIVSGDTQMLTVNNSNPTTPILNLIYNIPFGTVKLDANGKLPLNLLPTGSQAYLGTFDASGGLNPSEAFPTTTFNSGDTFLVTKSGTINVFDPDTLTSAPTPVEAGWDLVYDIGGVNPIGWYFIYIVAATTQAAVNVGIDPIAGMSATNVQEALAELNTDITAHVDDPTDAHDATAISSVPLGNLIATNVGEALNELQSDVDGRATTFDLAAHTSNTSNPHSTTAAQINAVGLIGDQSVSGVKTFTSNPISSAAQSTAADALTRKDYVDTLKLVDGDKGDIVVSNSGATWAIDANVVTLGKLARQGTAGQVLTSNGAGADPTYATPAASGGMVLGTAITPSGTSATFTSLPAGIKQITVSLYRVTINQSWPITFQIGAGGVAQTTGYQSLYAAVTTTNNTTTGAAATTGVVLPTIVNGVSGSIMFTLVDAATNQWAWHGSIIEDNTRTISLAGSVALSGSLNFLRMTIGGGSFTGGKMNVAYST